MIEFHVNQQVRVKNILLPAFLDQYAGQQGKIVRSGVIGKRPCWYVCIAGESPVPFMPHELEPVNEAPARSVR